MRSRLPTLRTSTADLVSSFIFANETLVNLVLGIDILYDASDPGAAFDSRDHYGRRCFPGTREQYIADITNWVTESVDPPSLVYWMRGPAGVGKSAIAQTCTEKLGILVLHSSSPSTNTQIHHAYSLPLLINLLSRSLIIAHLLMRGF